MSDKTILMTIGSIDARDACRGEPDIEMRVMKAMRAMINHWLVTGEVTRIQTACVSAMLESPNDAERDRIAESCKSLVELNNALAAAQAGVPVDIAAIPTPRADSLPIMALWQRAKGL